MSSYAKIITGQVLLISCCIVYLVWWSRAFRPGDSADRLGGTNGILLFVTAFFGIAGMIVTLLGNTGMPSVRKSPGGYLLLGTGVITYLILLGITRGLFHRIVTTELFLIVGWTVLELSLVSTLWGAARLGRGPVTALVITILTAFAISMILYVLYYRMEPWPAFYAAMVPLITEAAAMAAVAGVMLLSGR